MPGATDGPDTFDVDGYRRLVLEDVTPLPAEEVPIDGALGRTLAADVATRLDHPPFTNSAMDGYAVRVADVTDASPDRPVALPVAGESAAGGTPLAALPPGTAVRIMTGAPLPPGADAVVPVERTTERGGTVHLSHAPTGGDHIRRVGEELRSGDTIAGAGVRVTAALLGLLAASAVAAVPCRRRARVVVLSTGDELVPVARRRRPGQIPDSNGPMLAARAVEDGAEARAAGPIPDDPEALHLALCRAAQESDLVLVTGGVSAGRYDHLPEVLAALGPVRRARIAMRPGKPQVHGLVEGVPVLGLPGNPVSAFVSFELFALPLLRRLHGRARLDRAWVTAVAASDLRGSPGRTTFVRVRLRAGTSGITAVSTAGQRSHMLGGLAAADGLAEVPPDRPAVAAGEHVRVRLLDDPW